MGSYGIFWDGMEYIGTKNTNQVVFLQNEGIIWAANQQMEI